MSSTPQSVQFDTQSGQRTVDIDALEKMKLALQSFVDGPRFPPRFQEHREPMRAELKASAAWISEGEAGIGPWKLESRDGRLTLVNYPPPTRGTAYIYHATLESNDSGWKVVSLEQERELGPS